MHAMNPPNTPHPMTATDQTFDTCNALLIGEIAAVETYSQVIDKFDNATADIALERIRADHQQNVFELRKFIADSALEPASGSGTWTGIQEALQEAESLLGESPVLKTLQAGEELGISQYENALANADVSEAAKSIIKRTLLPILSDHLIELQQRRDPRPSFVGTFGVHPRDELFARVLAREHDEHKLRRQPRHEHAHQKLRGALRPAKSRFESQCCRPMRKGDGGRAERRAKSEHHDEPWPTQ